MNKKNIAILGWSGHIAKWLVCCFSSDITSNIFVFSRNIEKSQVFLWEELKPATLLSYNAFMEHEYDVIINCIWIWEPSKLEHSYIEQFQITEKYDDIVLRYLQNHSSTIYINISSWAAYNDEFLQPVWDHTVAKYAINSPNNTEYYGISKLYSEYKHRSYLQYNIVDIRVFSYFSHYLWLDSWFFLADAVKSIKYWAVLEVSKDEIWRDYVSYDELYRLIIQIILNPSNIACDIYSLAPISKTELLLLLQKQFNLIYKYKARSNFNPTWIKSYYYSLSRKAEIFGYKPDRSSAEVIVEQMKLILS